MLSMMISGPGQPGNDIDVYLSSLIEDLKKLWDERVVVFGRYQNETFKLRAMLFCTINDFPAYGNLSGHRLRTTETWKKNSIHSASTFSKSLSPLPTMEKAFNGCLEHDSATNIDNVPLEIDQVKVGIKEV